MRKTAAHKSLTSMTEVTICGNWLWLIYTNTYKIVSRSCQTLNIFLHGHHIEIAHVNISRWPIRCLITKIA